METGNLKNYWNTSKECARPCEGACDILSGYACCGGDARLVVVAVIIVVIGHSGGFLTCCRGIG